MGVDYYFQFDRCSLLIPQSKEKKFLLLVSNHYNHQYSIKANDPQWIATFHCIKKDNGILIDAVAPEPRSAYHRSLEFIQKIFRKYNGTLWGWTTNDHLGSYDFFKINNGRMRHFNFNDRPKYWLYPTTNRIEKKLLKGFNINDVVPFIEESSFFSTDKWNIQMSANEIMELVGMIYRKYFSNDEFESDIHHESGVVDNYFRSTYLKEYQKYQTTLSWSGPVVLTLNNLDGVEGNDIFVNFNLYLPYLVDHRMKCFLDLVELLIKITVQRNGTLWAFFETYPKKHTFIKIENGTIWQYPFSGRPEGW